MATPSVLLIEGAYRTAKESAWRSGSAGGLLSGLWVLGLTVIGMGFEVRLIAIGD
jgi:hypothetical protein